MPIEPVSIEEIKKMNVVMICLQQQRIGLAQHNPYTIDVDKRKNHNCYNCEGFGYLTRNYRSRRTRNRIGEERRLEYSGNNEQNNLKEKENCYNLKLRAQVALRQRLE